MSFGSKDPFEDLDPQWKTSVESMPEAEIRKKVSEIALNRRVFVENKKADVQLKELSAEKAKLCAPYKKLIDDADAKVQVAKMFLAPGNEFERQVSEAAFVREMAMSEMKNDQVIEEKTEEIKEASSSYTESIKGADLMIRYALSIIKARGKKAAEEVQKTIFAMELVKSLEVK